MELNEIVTHNKISPEKVIRGKYAWKQAKKDIPLICKSPLLLGRSKATEKIREKLYQDLRLIGLNPIKDELNYDCCEQDLIRISNNAINKNCDGIIASGGGKVLDAGKLISDRINLPCITIPLSAGTCAGWTALSNIYSKEGAFIKDQELKCCPKLLIFDHQFIRNAPRRTLASGIADALAKWYEASLSSSACEDGIVQQAVQMARVLRDQLFIDGLKAFNDSESDSWVRVAEGCALTAGLIGGLGGSQCRTAAAHPIHNGLTQIKSSKNSLHGEIVGFGIIMQLHLEEVYLDNQLAKQAKMQLISFLKELGLPTTIKALGLDKVSNNEIRKACEFTISNHPEIISLPINIEEKTLYDLLISYAGKDKSSVLSDIKI